MFTKSESRGASSRKLWLGLLALAALVALALAGRAVFDPAAAQAWVAAQRVWTQAHPLAAASAYFAAYVAFAALSLPGAWTISVAGGALFGPWAGPPLVAVSSACGATVAMLAARYWLRGTVAARYPDFLARVDSGVAAQGARWLFAARLTPVIPFFAINLAVGLTEMRAATFGLVTLVGVSPFAALYALAGSKLATVTSPADVFSPGLLVGLAGVGLAPVVWGRITRRA